ncbi:MAG TPA: tetratricopeptide repeat protein [Bryobacteraceae bacterium]|nr:tetratricopeptide repeat protein [Bryobacteraceae bacterium]
MSHHNPGIAIAAEGRMAEAIAHFEHALALNPDDAHAHSNLGTILKMEGRFDEAMAHFERALAIRPDYGEAHFHRSEIKSFHPGDADLAVLEALAARDDLSAAAALPVEFALAKALEDTGDYARAFEHLRKGNALKRRHGPGSR